MSQLFANLGGATASAALPPLVQQAAMQLLAQRPLLDASLSGRDVRVAFQNSGLFLEKTLATGAPASAGGEPMPDLKAALIVFRQLLSAQLGDAPATGSSQSQAGTSPSTMPNAAQAASPQIASDSNAASQASKGFAAAPGGATLVPDMAHWLDVGGVLGGMPKLATVPATSAAAKSNFMVISL